MLITTETMLLAHYQIHVLINTTIQLNAHQTVQIGMVTHLLASLTVLMQMEIHHSVHTIFHHGMSSATNGDHALIHQIQSGVNST